LFDSGGRGHGKNTAKKGSSSKRPLLPESMLMMWKRKALNLMNKLPYLSMMWLRGSGLNMHISLKEVHIYIMVTILLLFHSFTLRYKKKPSLGTCFIRNFINGGP
jgi:hypothetical protein